MTVDSAGKLRTRVTWSEESEVAAYSIKTFQFSLHLKDRAQKGDRYFLAIDEVIGSETLWRAVDSEKALRAYSRGQHDVVPKVRAVANKDDRERGPRSDTSEVEETMKRSTQRMWLRDCRARWFCWAAGGASILQMGSALAALRVPPKPTGELQVHVLDVGPIEGDSILIVSPARQIGFDRCGRRR